MPFSLTYPMFIEVSLLILGGWWCKEIFGRLRSDIADLKTPDSARRVVIVGLWAVTALILFFMVRFLWPIVAGVFLTLMHWR